MTSGPVPDDVIHPLQRLEQARDDLAERETVNHRLRLVGGSLRRAEAVRRQLGEELAREQLDVDRLQGRSVARLWSGLRGSRATDLERESVEAAQTAAAYDKASEGVETLQDEVARLTRRAAQLEHADRDYELALEALATATPTPFDDTTGPATDAVRELARIRESREIERTTIVARSALQSLAAAQEVLRRANSWSTFDTFGGGGLFSSSMKHRRLDEARLCLQTAADDLKRLSTLIDGQSHPLPAMPELTTLNRTMDVWFDNFFSDMKVLNQIHRCRDDIARSVAAVEKVLTVLDRRRRELLADDAPGGMNR
ncbi:hypothetical protein BA895_01460 [Humibacillus sp. DSM 29435]|nr:hypothetical protein BA895_01460 [Humibacillus sp. DSM 29435]